MRVPKFCAATTLGAYAAATSAYDGIGHWIAVPDYDITSKPRRVARRMQHSIVFYNETVCGNLPFVISIAHFTGRAAQPAIPAFDRYGKINKIAHYFT